MTGNEIINILNNNIPTVMSIIKSISGALLTAFFLRNNTSVEEFEKIKAGHFKDVAELLLASGKMTYTEYYKAKNFLMVAEKADQYYSQNHYKAQSTEYDFDWFVRFYEAVGNISDEKMQDLWAKILAGKVVNQSSYSLKTIDTLRNISQKDADLFLKIYSHSFRTMANDIFLPNNDDYLNTCNIQFIDVMRLSEQGLIFSDSTLSFNFPLTKEPKLLFKNSNLIMTISSEQENDMTAHLNHYPFTIVGKEIATLISSNSTDNDFIQYGRLLAKENSNYNFGIYQVVNWSDNSIDIKLNNLINEAV